MKLLVSLLVATTAVLHAGSADAGSCGSSGGGSSGGGSSSGGSSGGGGSSDSGSSSSTPLCTETSRVVGRSTCPQTRFGRWASGSFPRLQASFGTSFRSFPLTGMGFEGSGNHPGGPYAYSIPDRHFDTERGGAATFDMRGTGILAGPVYVGFEGVFGGASISGPARVLDGGMSVDPQNITVIQGGAVAGVVAELGGWRVHAEAVAGVRHVLLSTTTRVADCVSESFGTSTQATLEPRVGVSRWLSPWSSLGLTVGSDLVHEDSFSVGLTLNMHLRGFDGLRSR